MTSRSAKLAVPTGRETDALVLGRAGLDLYPEPDGCRIEDAASFSSDLGGSGGLIATAIARAGGRASLISALSNDAAGDFVRKRLTAFGVDTQHVTPSGEHARTSLALAEVRQEDCDVVIYRNGAADLDWQYSDELRASLPQCANVVVTGTCLIDESSRYQAFALLRDAAEAGCVTWLDLDYRVWNWPDPAVTRSVYREAARSVRVLVGNEDEFAVLDDTLDERIEASQADDQVMILKRGGAGASLYIGDERLDTGIYPVNTLKPYGSGDAFLGNLIIAYQKHPDWSAAFDAGAAAAALVVSQRGCGSVMPTPNELEQLRSTHSVSRPPTWN